MEKERPVHLTPLPWNRLGCYRYERRKRKKTEEKIRGYRGETRYVEGTDIQKLGKDVKKTRNNNYKRVTPKHNPLLWSKFEQRIAV